MSINIGPPSVEELRPRITVIGVGGAGGNAIGNMIDADIEGVDFIVSNTDAQALNNAVAEHRIQLGPEITQGLGAGSRPEVGRAAAEETVEEIERALDGVNMVFIAAGMGGGTGTGAAPVIAQTARAKGILTVGVVTKPFLFEGTRRMRAAEAGIEELQKHVDTLIVIPNQNLFLVAKADTTFKEAFGLADEVLQQGVRSITDLMVMPGLINLDFADVRSVMGEMGKAMMGTGEGEGDNRALEAAERAIANPLLDGVSMHGAKGVIISIIGGEDMKLLEVDEAANHIREMVDPEANIIWGSAFNPDLDGKIRVSVVATGIEVSGEGQGSTTSAGASDYSAQRGPKKPVLPFADPQAASHTDEEQGDDADDGTDALDLSGMESVTESEDADVETPVDEPADGLPEPASDTGFGASTDDGFARDLASDDSEDDGAESVEPEPTATADAPEQDELLLDASRLAEEDEPVQAAADGATRRRIIGAGASHDDADASDEATDAKAAVPADPASKAPSAGGSTLFERMASLSRGTPASDDDDEDEGGSAMRIPRFLGRQNNQ